MKNLLDFDFLNTFFSEKQLLPMRDKIIQACEKKLDKHHGDVHRWQQALQQLPHIEHANIAVTDDYITLSGSCDMSREALQNTLKCFSPWRKGPFSFLEIDINTEWDSLMKWRRVQQSLATAGISLHNKHIIDIGCGNGAFMWPMLEDGAKTVTGVDPMWLFYHQFMVFQRNLKKTQACFLPLGVQDIPLTNSYDVALSMGVLYHRRSPLDHISQMKGLLKKGGIFIMETIVLPNKERILLTPPDRYAGMRNVWMIPSVAILQDWLIKMGFTLLHTSKLSKTTLSEQRQSEWMDYHSLNQFLDTDNDEITIEGHPAPYRVIIIAQA